MDDWLTGGLTNRWFGLRGTESGSTFRWYDVRLSMGIWQPPLRSSVTLANDQVLSTTTPILRGQAIPSGTCGGLVRMELQITTAPAPGSGLVVSDSRQFSSGSVPEWPVAPGTLQEGVTYWAWVLPNCDNNPDNHIPPTFPLLEDGRRFTVDLGLGDGGPSPVDEVGSVPGKASKPSEGAPSPSLPGSKLTVNLVDGNLSLGVGTPSMGTLSGGSALGFTYNSLSANNHGLRAEFYNDTNDSGSIDSGDVLVGERVDPTVGFDWGVGARAVAAQDPTKALGRWTGFLNVPTTGTWEIGAISSDGLRASVDGTLRLDRWESHEPETEPVFGTSFEPTAGQPVPISIEWRNNGGAGVARVFLRHVSGNNPIYELSPAWLTRNPSVLPNGWTFNGAAGAAHWVGLEDHGTSVSMFASNGSAHEFVASGDGSYAPPDRAPNDLLATGDAGRFVLRDGAGSTYTFRADGSIESLVTAADDRNPAALRYAYSGTPARLRTITDPVSDRSITLSYGGDTACSGAPAAAAGLLCHVAFWDGTATTLTYDGSGRFVRLTNPGSVIFDLAYDSLGRLTDVRDPLAVDAVAAGVRPDDANSRTQITYDSTGRVATVTQPKPTPTTPRPVRTYSYNASGRTGSVSVAGFTPTVGFAKRARYDERNRIVERTDSAGLSTTFAWDDSDRLISETDPGQLRTTTIYDHTGRPIKTHGPAPASSFEADGTPKPTATVPTETKVYDGGIAGLAAAYWTNPYLAGGPALHDTGLGAGGALDKDWGAAPPVTPGTGGWGARYSGYLIVTTPSAYEFQVNTKGSRAKVWVDNKLVVDHDQAEPASGWATTTGTATNLSAGYHRIRVDMVDTAGPSGLQVLWKPSSGSFAVVPGAALSPNYGLVTSVADADGKVTATEYSDPPSGIGPHHGLVTATVADPDVLNLRTTTAYESPGPGSFLRRVAKTLPAGNGWTTEFYGATEGPVASVCGVSAGTPQGGMSQRITGPDPDGAGPGRARVEEFVYDVLGRRVGRRLGTEATVDSAGWECTAYDLRGRMLSRTWPAHGSAAARTVNYIYASGGNPIVNKVVDSSWGTSSVSMNVDMLGRTRDYTDIWGNVVSTTYDQAGRQTSTTGPLGTLTQNYDPATGRATTTVLQGNTLATPTYESSTGRLHSVAYGNGAGTVFSYDTNGRESGVGVVDNQGWSGDVVERSLAGRVKDQDVFSGGALVDAAPSQDNYVYDGAGRLTEARLPGTTYAYGYGTATGCTAPAAGANTNRTNLTVTGAGGGTTTSCYNHADQLVSTSAIPAGEIAYDDHGNTTRLGGEYFDFDSADRHVRTESLTNVTTYRRDPLDRIAERTDMTRITHVATTSNSAALSSVNVAKPGGTQVGDLIVASVSATALTAPGNLTASGWTVAADRANGAGRTWVVWRRAASGDPTSWSFSVASATNTTAALSTYRSPTSASPIAVTATGSANLATSHPLPQVTTTADAQHLVHVVGFSGPVAPGAPSGATQRAAVNSGASLLVADRYQSRPGASSALSATSNLPANSSSITVTLVPLTTVGRYGYPGHTDNPQFTKNVAGGFIDMTVALMGNTSYVVTASGINYSHANLHGDAVTVTNATRNRVWTGFSGAYGEAIDSAPPNTNVSGTSWRWHGEQQRITDRSIVHMGARPYSPLHGRFLAVDSIEGGCANDYMYAYGDPINTSDLDGRGFWPSWEEWKCAGVALVQTLVPFARGTATQAPWGGPSGQAGALLTAGLSLLRYGTKVAMIAGGATIVAGVVVAGINLGQNFNACIGPRQRLEGDYTDVPGASSGSTHL